MNRLVLEKAIEVVAQSLGRRVPPCRVFLQALQADRLQVARQTGTQVAWGDGIGLEHQAKRLGRSLTPEWRAAGQDLVEGGPEGVHVGRRPDVPAAAGSLLGGHVRRRTHRHAGSCLLARLLRDPRQSRSRSGAGQTRFADTRLIVATEPATNLKDGRTTDLLGWSHGAGLSERITLLGLMSRWRTPRS